MTSLHVRRNDATGSQPIYSGRWLQLDRVTLPPGASHTVRAPARDEGVVLLIRGSVAWNDVSAGRSSPFHERAHAAYLPPDAALEVPAPAHPEMRVATSRF